MDLLKRSEEKLNAVSLKLASLCKIEATQIQAIASESQWSLRTNQGKCLLNTEENPLFFVGCLHAIHEHAGLLKGAVATFKNDLSKTSFVIVGPALGGGALSIWSKENLVWVLNAAVADSLQLFCDEIADAKGDAKPVLKKHLKTLEPIFYTGKGVDAYAHFLEKKSQRALEGIMTESEIRSYYRSLLDGYVKDAMRLSKEDKLLEGLGLEAKAKVCQEIILDKIKSLDFI